MDHTRTATFYLKRITGLILLLALSAVFLFSAFSKLLYIRPFEWSFSDILPVGMTGAAVIARLFVGLELAMGLFLLGHVFLKKFTYPATLVLLGLLTAYLALLLLNQGNTGSCGCFGEAYQMKPAAAIWKNVLMAAATVVLLFIYPVKPYRWQWAVALAITLGSFALPFVLEPVYISGTGKVVHRPINLDPLYRFADPVPRTDLRKGKQVLIFMSLTCPHCRKAGYYLQVMYRQHPELPFFAVLGGRPSDLRDFFAETQSQKVPHTLVQEGHAFSSMAGDSVPAIYFVNNGVVERELFYVELDPANIREWLKRP